MLRLTVRSGVMEHRMQHAHARGSELLALKLSHAACSSFCCFQPPRHFY